MRVARRSAPEQRQDAVADQLDPGLRRAALRRSELDAVRAGRPQLLDARGDLLRGAGDA